VLVVVDALGGFVVDVAALFGEDEPHPARGKANAATPTITGIPCLSARLLRSTVRKGGWRMAGG
jgi:hypothetical protein